MQATRPQAREQSVGHNRTGVKASPMDGRKLESITSDAPPPESLQATRMREEYTRRADQFGSVPLVATAKGVAEMALQALQGHRLASFIDRLGERLAFERSGVRAYQAVLVKIEALGTWQGGPTRDLLQEQLDEELRHFHMLKRTLERLGADPTAMTPSADVAAVEASGVFKVLADPRTSLSQALHALLVLEDVDADGWDMLVEIAANNNQKDLASEFRNALASEETHKARVRGWLGKAVIADAQRKSDRQSGAAMH
ncbi:MAG TPA: ferritin-like domain-containing protein [Rhodanobacteraceae bacterium]|nr:ferritin-like domain-containing protein [Rhodanobacteraceae bacterium]